MKKNQIPPSDLLDHLRLQAVFQAPLDITEPGAAPLALVPVIFSHALMNQGVKYSGHLAELVSQGYIVFAIDHLDGSCGYTELQERTQKPFQTQFEYYDLNARKEQSKKREKEIEHLIDDIFEEGFLQNGLQFPGNVQLDKSKLIVSGHHFGGATAIGAAAKDKRIKMCLPLDPWFFPYQDEPLPSLKATPVLTIKTQYWYDMC